MKKKYVSPEANVTRLEGEVFLQASGEVAEQDDNLFVWGWQ